MRKHLITSILLILFVHTIAVAQSYKYIYYLDNNLASTDSSNAIFIAKGMTDKGLIQVDYFYKTGGAAFMSIHFTDSSLANMTGFFRSFHLNGRLENEGLYKNNLEDGLWQKWDSSGNKIDSSVFNDGQRIAHASYVYYKHGLYSYEFLDSINDKYRFITYDDAGIINSEAEFSGYAGTYKMYDSGKVITTPIVSRERKEAGFTGGDAGWRKYLQENLNALVPINNKAAAGSYQVIVRFIVNKDGSVSDIKAETNFGRGMEEEVIRIIKKSPRWQPAILFGVPVKAYRRQPVTFVVQEN